MNDQFLSRKAKIMSSKRYQVTVSGDISQKLEELRDKTGISRSGVVSLAIAVLHEKSSQNVERREVGII